MDLFTLSKQYTWVLYIVRVSVVTGRGPIQAAVCLYVQNIKKCMGILKTLNIVNLYQGMSMLKLKMNINLPQLLCIVVSAGQNGELSNLVGFALSDNV